MATNTYEVPRGPEMTLGRLATRIPTWRLEVRVLMKRSPENKVRRSPRHCTAK